MRNASRKSGRGLSGQPLSVLSIHRPTAAQPGQKSCDYLVGIWAAPEAGATGAGTAEAAGAGELVPGIWAAPDAAGAGAGAVALARSSTLPESAGRRLPK